MGKKQRQFSIWYFVVAIIIMIGIQNFLAKPQWEPVPYSRFKDLVRSEAFLSG